MRCIAVIILLLMGSAGFSQIAPECAGVEKPADYDEGQQRSFMQNYFIGAFMPVPFSFSHPSSQLRSSAGLEMSFIPRLSCQQRLVLGGTKTENTAQTPLFPRLFANGTLFSFKEKLSLSLGASVLPPLPIPHLSLWYASTQATLSYEPIVGMALHLRGFIDLFYLRSEIATPFDSNDPIKDDWFIFASLGSDIAASFAIPLAIHHKLFPFISFGIIKGASIFVVGDDNKAVPNEDYSLLSATNFIGTSYHPFDGQLQITLAAGGVIGTTLSGHAQIGYGF